jgi:hypothetical protein
VADPAELAPLVDGVFLVYTVGKIGRGVLRRAKSTLDNVDARILGVIMNRVKADNGPEYLQYHNQYYYKSDEPLHRHDKSRKRNQPEPQGTAKAGKITRLAGGSALAVAVIIAAVGFFWPDLQNHLPGWLNALR